MNLDDDELSTLIRRHATRYAAPDTLRAGIRTQIALDEARGSGAPKRARWFGWAAAVARGFNVGWGTTAAGSFALGMLCMALVLPLLHDLQQPLAEDFVADHVRALQVGPIVAVVSTDRHTVKPWFQGRIDYSPPVYDLASDGFPLIGGRIEHVAGDAIATLTYARGSHLIDLFIRPSTLQQAPEYSMHRGFNVVRWADGAMQYWVVSGMDREEVETFTRLCQERLAAE